MNFENMQKWEKAQEILEKIQTIEIEEAYRRGYRQGFSAARNPKNENISYQEVAIWSDDIDENNIFDSPIGSPSWHLKNEKA